jgi:hypothetical protein
MSFGQKQACMGCAQPSSIARGEDPLQLQQLQWEREESQL